MKICTALHYTGEQPCTYVDHKSIFKAAVVKPLAKYNCMGNFYSLITFVPSPNEVVLKLICADFKGLLNGANFILIDHCVDKLLSINKVRTYYSL